MAAKTFHHAYFAKQSKIRGHLVLHFNHGHLLAALDEQLGDFKSDEAAADDNDVAYRAYRAPKDIMRANDMSAVHTFYRRDDRC
ncbi:hypothetical protein D3C81_2152700 [compost metagenome]